MSPNAPNVQPHTHAGTHTHTHTHHKLHNHTHMERESKNVYIFCQYLPVQIFQSLESTLPALKLAPVQPQQESTECPYSLLLCWTDIPPQLHQICVSIWELQKGSCGGRGSDEMSQEYSPVLNLDTMLTLPGHGQQTFHTNDIEMTSDLYILYIYIIMSIFEACLQFI